VEEAVTEPPQLYGSPRIEIAWTLGPLLIVFLLFLVVIRIVVVVRGASAPPPGDLLVRVVAHQWWWRFDYPDLGVTTADELHVPLSTPQDPQTVYLRLESADVAHSFWVPRLAGKTDVIPGRVNTMSFQPTEAGVFHGQCAEYCGMEHAGMLIRVVVEPLADFRRWIAAQRRPAVEDPTQEAGRQLFFSLTCFNCHTIRGTLAEGTFGPDLTHLMSRQTLASGVILNDREHLTEWLKNPQAVKPGCYMPDLDLTDKEVETLVNYLETLR
jgi:cytochrome c oxidase subunit 2